MPLFEKPSNHAANFGGDVRLQRRTEMNSWMSATGGETAPLMGTAFRQVLTGEVRLERVPKRLDYSLIDLWTRPCIFGKISNVITDPFLFKPVPMTYRTWIYHSLYRGGMNSLSAGEDLMTSTLKQPCIDTAAGAGRFSPAIYYFPACIGAAITGDKIFVTICLLMAGLMHRLAMAFNNAQWYRWTRIGTLPFRLAFVLFLLSNMGAGASSTHVLGSFMVLAAAILDFVTGDLRQFQACNLICSYEIIRELPNRVFVCRREGAITTNDPKNRVAECVSGVAVWEKSMVLIADIKGLLVELRPAHHEDWIKLSNEYVLDHKPQDFYGLDIFDDEVPNAASLLKAMAKSRSATTQEELLARYLQAHAPAEDEHGHGHGHGMPPPPNASGLPEAAAGDNMPPAPPSIGQPAPPNGHDKTLTPGMIS